ncbi:hypothetical protein [Photobacterium minamisatsumaniensis]|uniref:hypothetical protein n=1 Tax=Photobacterium minamisatsumaniensis TaxID=2910233 RepID=UPI003D0FB0E7
MRNSGDDRIYANGRMQAEVFVLFELGDGEEVSSITFKRKYTNNNIEDYDWRVSSQSNGYPHFISPNAYSTSAVSASSDLESAFFYISTEKSQNMDVCVELTTKSGAVQDTCWGENANGVVPISAVLPPALNFNELSIEESNSIQNNGASIKNYNLTYTGSSEEISRLDWSVSRGTEHSAILLKNNDNILSTNVAARLTRSPASYNSTNVAIIDRDTTTVKYTNQNNQINSFGSFDLKSEDDTFLSVLELKYNYGFLYTDRLCVGPFNPSSANPIPYRYYTCPNISNVARETSVSPHLSNLSSFYLLGLDVYGNAQATLSVSFNSSGNIELEWVKP